MLETTLIILNLFVSIILILFLITNKKKQKVPENNLLDPYFSKTEVAIREEMSRSREELLKINRENREETNNSFIKLSELLINQLKINEEKTEKLVQLLNESFRQFSENMSQSSRENRNEISTSLKSFEEKFTFSIKDFNELQKQKFNDLSLRHEQLKSETERKLEEIRNVIEKKLLNIQEENNRKLEEMRLTVDEKLQATVEKRFNESFKLISERLEQVHKGLGEMQTLASGVGDLKKVLTNVKARGTLGEIQLGIILEQILSAEQFIVNAVVKEGSAERVEFAVKLPGKDSDDKPVLLPIDSKFPVEDYQRLTDAFEQIASVNPKEMEEISRQFENSVKKSAKEIQNKYINPPVTTDFAIMFVPTEGLYAEILRRPGLFELLQREYRVTVVGPANLVAFLSSLQMGFRTLAIQKRSGEVWNLLGAVKTEFGRFSDVLSKTKKKLQEAANTIDMAGTRTRAIERKLREVQELPHNETNQILSIEPDEELPNDTE